MEQLAIAPAITVLINVIKPFIPNKNLLPIVAILFGWLTWLFVPWDMVNNVIEGIIIWSSAVWLHQLSKISNNAEIAWVAVETLHSNIREDV